MDPNRVRWATMDENEIKLSRPAEHHLITYRAGHGHGEDHGRSCNAFVDYSRERGRKSGFHILDTFDLRIIREISTVESDDERLGQHRE